MKRQAAVRPADVPIAALDRDAAHVHVAVASARPATGDDLPADGERRRARDDQAAVAEEADPDLDGEAADAWISAASRWATRDGTSSPGSTVYETVWPPSVSVHVSPTRVRPVSATTAFFQRDRGELAPGRACR